MSEILCPLEILAAFNIDWKRNVTFKPREGDFENPVLGGRSPEAKKHILGGIYYTASLMHMYYDLYKKERITKENYGWNIKDEIKKLERFAKLHNLRKE